MKFTKSTFFILGATVGVFLSHVNAMACSNRTPASAGYVCLYNSSVSCKPGCYCRGGGYEAVSESDFEEGCSERWSKWENHGGGWTLCPSGFPYSDAGASSAQDCYTYWIVENGSRKVYNKKINCPAGMFIQSGFPWCMGCKDNENVKSTEYCPGVEDFPSQTENYRKGVSACTGKVSDDKKTCMEVKNCPAGSYMPKKSKECEECLPDYVCLGGNYEVDYPTDQGKLLPKDACTSEHGFDDTNYVANGYGDRCDKCPIGTKANADHTECVETSIKVTKGYYLPANSVQQQKCNNSCKFCPGGEFWKSSVDQGQYDCPTCSSAPFYASCSISLTPEQMEFGAIGNNSAVACWTKTDPYDYQYCVFGLRGIRASGGQNIRTEATARPVQQVSVSSVNR